MSDLFCPPEGAMQFELTERNAAIAGVPFIWVDNGAVGECARGHKLYRALNPPQAAVTYARKVLGHTRGHIPTVCACSGKVIE